MLVQRTLPIALPEAVGWSGGVEVRLDPGDEVDFRFIRAHFVLLDAGTADCSPCVVLRDSAGSLLGMWTSHAPAGGAAIGAGDNAHINIDSAPPFKTLGSTMLTHDFYGSVRFVQVTVPEALIVLSTHRLYLTLMGAGDAEPNSFAFFTFAFDDGLDRV